MTLYASESDSVKVEALNLYSSARLASEASKQEELHQIRFYVSRLAENFEIQAVSLSVDGREVVKYKYSELESRLLFDGGVHPLLTLSLPPGSHQIAAKFVVINRDAGPNADRLFPRIEKDLTLTGNTQLELELLSEGMAKWLKKPSILLHDRGEEDPALNSDSNPFLRAVYFNARRHYAFEALAEAMYYVKKGGQVAQFSPRLQQTLKQSAVELGLAALPSELANIGDPASSARASDDIYQKFNSGVGLINRGKAAEGVAILDALSYTIRESNGSGTAQNSNEALLGDKINLSLGFYFLQQGDSERAVNYFSEVRRLSPYANKALVGLGWALLSPRQTAVQALADSDISAPGRKAKNMAYLWSGSEDDIAWARRHTPFRRAWAIASGAKEEDLQAAMVPWMELINRDPLDPAVQEGLLILPYAMSHWAGQGARAESYYVSAVNRLQESLLILESAAEDVRSGGLLEAVIAADKDKLNGWGIWLCDLSADRQGAYLDLLLDSSSFHFALREFRQLGRIVEVLGGVGQVGSASSAAGGSTLLGALDKLKAQWGLKLERAAIAELDKHRQRTERYLAEANFAMARNHENARRQLTEVVWDGEAGK